MRKLITLLFVISMLMISCASQKKLGYLNNLTKPSGEEQFPMEIPDYKVQNRDILYISLKAMNQDGLFTDFLSGTGSGIVGTSMQSEGGGYLSGYIIDKDGNILLPVLGSVNVEGMTLSDIKKLLQDGFSKTYKNAIVDCKLLSFKFTVIGEVRVPGTYFNYNNYLTVLEAIGRAGSVDDFGRRDNVLVVRPTEKGTKTYKLNLQDKAILSSDAYFILPNDVIIVEPLKQKIFNLNLPTISFILTSALSAVSTTLLLINYFGK